MNSIVRRCSPGDTPPARRHEQTLGALLELPRRLLAVDGDAGDLELDRVEHERVGLLGRGDGDLDPPTERRRCKIGLELEVVAQRNGVARQPVRIEPVGQRGSRERHVTERTDR